MEFKRFEAKVFALFFPCYTLSNNSVSRTKAGHENSHSHAACDLIFY